MGAKYLDRNVQALAVNGRLAIIGMQGGVKGELNLGALLSKRAAVSATSLRARPLARRPRSWRPYASTCGRCSRPARPPGRRPRLPMSDAAAAHRVVEESGHVGKVLLVAP